MKQSKSIALIISFLILLALTAIMVFGRDALVRDLDQALPMNDYIPLKEYARQYQMEIGYSLSEHKITLIDNGLHYSFVPESNIIISSDGKIHTLKNPLIYQSGGYYISENEFNAIFNQAPNNIHPPPTYQSNHQLNYSSPSASRSNNGSRTSLSDPIRTIIIDPGHGGSDPGNVPPGGNILEKVVTLALSIKVKEKLRSLLPNIQIIMTRTNDRYVSLEDRTEYATGFSKPNEASLFISIHANATLNREVYGVETYYYSPSISNSTRDIESFRLSKLNQTYSVSISQILQVQRILSKLLNEEMAEESRKLAMAVHSQLYQQIGTYTVDRGIKIHRFQVLAYINQPSILVETGFLTNPREAANLTSSWYQNKCAAGIAEGIKSFIDQYQYSSGFRDE